MSNDEVRMKPKGRNELSKSCQTAVCAHFRNASHQYVPGGGPKRVDRQQVGSDIIWLRMPPFCRGSRDLRHVAALSLLILGSSAGAQIRHRNHTDAHRLGSTSDAKRHRCDFSVYRPRNKPGHSVLPRPSFALKQEFLTGLT